MKSKKCIDCGIEVGRGSILGRCKFCCKIGKLSPNYKGGSPNCIDCDKQLKDYRSIRCYSCAMSYKMENGGKDNMVKKMRGKRTSIRTEFIKGHIISKEMREKISITKGGTGIPYEYALYNDSLFTKELKLQIRIRDNFICQGCGLKEKDHYRNLDIHHIDYNKDNCLKINLISLCSSCNVKANFNEDYWFAYYTYIMENYDIYKLCN